MKKALLIGKFNQVTREIGNCLSSQCHVQLCSDNKEILKGMLKMTEPQLVVISLTGISITVPEIFALLPEDGDKLPLLFIGSREDEEELTLRGYIPRERIRFLQRPVNQEVIAKSVQELLYSEPETGGEPVDDRATILLVDDSPALLRTMQAMLSRKYKVTFATSGIQAIASIAKNRPDLILLDYDMPVCDGKMTLQMLRTEEATKNIPVVFLTGMAEFDQVVDLMALRPQGYLLKPCTQEKVFTTIENVLQGKPLKVR